MSLMKMVVYAYFGINVLFVAWAGLCYRARCQECAEAKLAERRKFEKREAIVKKSMEGFDEFFRGVLGNQSAEPSGLIDQNGE